MMVKNPGAVGLRHMQISSVTNVRNQLIPAIHYWGKVHRVPRSGLLQVKLLLVDHRALRSNSTTYIRSIPLLGSLHTEYRCPVLPISLRQTAENTSLARASATGLSGQVTDMPGIERLADTPRTLRRTAPPIGVFVAIRGMQKCYLPAIAQASFEPKRFTQNDRRRKYELSKRIPC